ncbi:hypothetical protein D3C87_1653740 [compost metagenome]
MIRCGGRFVQLKSPMLQKSKIVHLMPCLLAALLWAFSSRQDLLHSFKVRVELRLEEQVPLPPVRQLLALGGLPRQEASVWERYWRGSEYSPPVCLFRPTR